VYQSVKAKIDDWTDTLGSQRRPFAREVVVRENEEYSANYNDAFSDGSEDNYHDGLFHTKMSAISFASSNQSFERAFFYAELAGELGVALLPRPSRFESFLSTISRSYKQSAHELVKDKIKNFDQLMRPESLRLRFPPLAQSIALRSLREGRAGIEIAAELRESKKAQAYRVYTDELQAELRSFKSIDSSAFSKKVKALSKLTAELDRVVEHWSEDGDPDEGVKYRTRELRIEILPAAACVGALLGGADLEGAVAVAAAAEMGAKSFFGDTMFVRDPILWGGEKYISFISDWYS
jgi:hypothetical protein